MKDTATSLLGHNRFFVSCTCIFSPHHVSVMARSIPLIVLLYSFLIALSPASIRAVSHHLRDPDLFHYKTVSRGYLLAAHGIAHDLVET